MAVMIGAGVEDFELRENVELYKPIDTYPNVHTLKKGVVSARVIDDVRRAPCGW